MSIRRYDSQKKILGANLTLAKFLCIFTLNDENKAVRVGGVKYTVKDGIISTMQRNSWKMCGRWLRNRNKSGAGIRIVLPGLKK